MVIKKELLDELFASVENPQDLMGDVPHFGGPTAMLVSGGQYRPDVTTGA